MRIIELSVFNGAIYTARVKMMKIALRRTKRQRS